MKDEIYKKKHFKTLDDLDEHQQKLKDEYRLLGKEIASDILNPGNLAFAVAGEAIKRIKNKKRNKRKQPEYKSSIIKKRIAFAEKPKKSKKSILKILLTNTWIKWQLLFVSLILAKKIVTKIKLSKHNN